MASFVEPAKVRAQDDLELATTTPETEPRSPVISRVKSMGDLEAQQQLLAPGPEQAPSGPDMGPKRSKALASTEKQSLLTTLCKEGRDIIGADGDLGGMFWGTVYIEVQQAIGKKTDNEAIQQDLRAFLEETTEGPLADARRSCGTQLGVDLAFGAQATIEKAALAGWRGAKKGDEEAWATQAAKTKAASLLSSARAQLPKKALTKRYVDMARAVVERHVEGEVDKRTEADDTIDAVAGAPALAAYEALHTKINKQIAKGLGKGGAGFTRSSEVRAFRGKMKTAARQQAKQDVEQATEEVDGAGPATKRHVEIVATSKTHQGVKPSVDTVLAEKALEGTEEVLAGEQEKAATWARRAAWGVLRDAPTKTKLAKSKATTAIKAWKKHAEPAAVARARAWKNAIVKPGSSPEEQAHSQQETVSLEQRTKQQVHGDGVGEKAVEKALKASTTEAGLGKIGKLLDDVVPNAGDQASLKIELQIPIPNSPAFVSIGFEGKAARGIDGAMTAGVPTMGDPNRLEVMSQFTLGAGVETWGLKADGSIGFFLRGGAASTEKAMKAVSYGAYRSACALSGAFGNWWAGDGSGTGTTKTERAEAWAAMVEERVFSDEDDGAYVDLGVSGSLGGAGISGGGGVFRRYDKGTLEKSLNGDDEELFAQPVTSAGMAAKRRSKASGKTGASYNLAANLSCKIAGQSVAFAGAFSGNASGDWGLEITAGVSIPAGDQASALEKIAAGIIGGAVSIASQVDGARKGHGSPLASTVDTAGDVATIANAGLDNQLTNALASLWSVEKSKSDHDVSGLWQDLEVESEAGLAANNSVTLALIFGQGGGKGIFRFEVRQSKGAAVKVGAGSVGISVAVDKTKRLAAIGYEDGGWVAEAIGKKKQLSGSGSGSE